MKPAPTLVLNSAQTLVPHGKESLGFYHDLLLKFLTCYGNEPRHKVIREKKKVSFFSTSLSLKL